MTKREIRARRARTLQTGLGSKYTVLYDVCESGMSEIHYTLSNNHKIIVKRFKNAEFDNQFLDVNAYRLPQGLATYYYNLGLL